MTREDDHWRSIDICFDIAANTCDVTIGGQKVLSGVSTRDVTIPKVVCIGVCAGDTIPQLSPTS